MNTFETAGAAVQFTFVITNVGSVPLQDVTLSDLMPGLGAITCSAPIVDLAVGASNTCYAPYTTTAADVTAGEIENTATVSGVSPAGSTVEVSDETVITYPGSPVPQPPMPATGSTGSGFLVPLGLGALILGVLAVLIARRPRRSLF